MSSTPRASPLLLEPDGTSRPAQHLWRVAAAEHRQGSRRSANRLAIVVSSTSSPSRGMRRANATGRDQPGRPADGLIEGAAGQCGRPLPCKQGWRFTLTMAKQRIILLGDSIIDNGAYVRPGEADVAKQLQTLLPQLAVIKRAVDGAVCAD